MATVDDDELEVVAKEAVVHHHNKIRHAHKHKHEHKVKGGRMSGTEPVNVFTSPMMGAGYGACGGGFGGLGGEGLIGGLLVGSLLRGGLWNGGGAGVLAAEGGGFGRERCATTEDLISINNLSKLGDIQNELGNTKAAIALAESQVQLALAGVQDNLTTDLLQQTIALSQGQTAIQLSQANSLNLLSNQIYQNGFEGAKSAWELSNNIRDDGEKTRSLIGSIDRDNLNRQIEVLSNEVIELRNENRRAVDTHSITIQNTQNQNSLQSQLQSQAQAQALFNDRVFRELCDVSQLAKATNAQINIGSGTLTGAAQTANPINTRI